MKEKVGFLTVMVEAEKWRASLTEIDSQ